MFVKTLLMISGVNKNYFGGTKTPETSEEPILYRSETFIEGSAPSWLMDFMHNEATYRFTGMMSFTDKRGLHGDLQPVFIAGSRQQCIDTISKCEGEREYLFPPTVLQYQKTEVPNQFKAKFVWGVATESLDEYLVELALTEAYEVAFSKPYQDEPSEKYKSIYRPNHGLAHHVRVVSYADDVIAYFANYANSPQFKTFCKSLSAEKIQHIKILLAFSRAGRESECSWDSDPVNYQRDKKSSARMMRSFMEAQTNVVSDTLDEYEEILMNMSDPAFTGDGERFYIAHIVTLAHMLDLLRCSDPMDVRSSLSIYEPGNSFIVSDDEARHAFQLLNQRVELALLATGYQKEGEAFRYSAEFELCNRYLFHCWMLCKAVDPLSDVKPVRLIGTDKSEPAKVDIAKSSESNPHKISNLDWQCYLPMLASSDLTDLNLIYLILYKQIFTTEIESLKIKPLKIEPFKKELLKIEPLKIEQLKPEFFNCFFKPDIKIPEELFQHSLYNTENNTL